ncbi:MAG: hypothetical protein WA705_25935 [Candidatus Ozemobacteraceae bacterium]
MSAQYQPLNKSRLDVIDTALQKDQERRAFGFLMGLFVLTLFYEFGGPLIEAWATSGIIIAEIPKQESKLLSFKKIEKLSTALRQLGEEHPAIRDLLAVDCERLASLSTALAQKGPTAARAQVELATVLNGLWKRFHQPTWPNASWFVRVNTDIEFLLILLKTTPDSTIELPALDFGPRPLKAAEDVNASAAEKISSGPGSDVGASGNDVRHSRDLFEFDRSALPHAEASSAIALPKIE